MNAFETRISVFPAIWQTYNEAMEIAQSGEMEDLDYFLSKNCRAYFFEHHLKVEREGSDQEIRDINAAAIVPLVMTNIQLMILEKFEKRMLAGKKFRTRIMKCRRARVSTIWLAVGYHIARFGHNKKGLVFADRLETSRKLRRILEIFYQGDDLSRKPVVGKKTLCEGLYFHDSNEPDRNITEHDSFMLLGSGEQANSGIGGSLDFMIWSEASLTKDAEKHWTTISPSMQGALFDVAESTPSLTGQDAIIFPEFENPSPKTCDAFFISWMDVAEYRIDDLVQQKEFAPFLDHHLYGKEIDVMTEFDVSIPQMLWRRFKLDELKNLNAFRQVFPISKEEAFYASAGLVFHRQLIDLTMPSTLLDGDIFSFSDQGGMNISMVLDPSGGWRVYEPPSINMKYLIACDIAEGRHADRDGRDPDYSVGMVFRMGPCVTEVAIFRDRVSPEVFAEQVAAAAKHYNNAFVIPERNNAGLAFLGRLMQFYQNIYRHQKFQTGSFVSTQDYGFLTTSLTKAHAISCLLSRIRDSDKGMKLHTDAARKEMGKFAQSGSKFGALSGFHDDIVTCLWLMAVCVFQTPTLTLSVSVDELTGQSSPRMYVPKIERHEWNYAD